MTIMKDTTNDHRRLMKKETKKKKEYNSIEVVMNFYLWTKDYNLKILELFATQNTLNLQLFINYYNCRYIFLNKVT